MRESARVASRTGTLFSIIPFDGLLMLNPRVAIVGGVQDQAIVALSHRKCLSSRQVLPTIYIKSSSTTQFYVYFWHSSLASSTSQDVYVH